MRGGLFSAVLVGVATFAVAGTSSAQTGVCDANAANPTACINAIQASGGVVNDIFTDANGLTAQQLPVYGVLFNAWPNCPTATSFAGCAGRDMLPYECPGQYACDAGVPNTFANASNYYATPDHLWWHPCRLASHPADINACPSFDTCIANGVGGAYFPWEGAIFDLGGPSNQVAIFATNDHGPQPCESAEYTVFLSDNPFAKEVILTPTTDGVDPNKWNRAVLSKIYTKGWEDIRPADPAGHAACGDTALYAVEQDSFVTVYSLPCGITFRYTAIVAGNDGLDFPECAFDSNEGEIDAIAGLTESGEAVCPDVDGDLFVDCACTGAPAICDCDDGDPDVHPGAPEPCDADDLNCDGEPGGCAAGLHCYQSICIEECSGGEFDCPAGSDCLPTREGDLCVPDDCTVGGCPPGTVCEDGLCKPACEDVVCPGDQICQNGLCVDPCEGVVCPAGKTCQSGECRPPCNCYAGDLGCVDFPDTVCDADSDSCVDPICVGVTCTAPETCNPATGECDGICTRDVQCPAGQKCVEPEGCVPLCSDVTCQPGFECNPATGDCVDLCEGVTCLSPKVCVEGECVDTSGAGGAGGGGSNSVGGGGAASDGGSGGGVGGDGNADDGCNCDVGSSGSSPKLTWLLGLAALGLVRRRRPVRR